eukprot:XP_024449961.1 auxin response factor 18-like [Populus trichocarpa]
MVKEKDLEKWTALEEKIRAVEGDHLCDLVKAVNMCLVSNIVIPKKFRVPEFIKYTGIQCPITHLKVYYNKMAEVVDDEKLLIHFFQDSLSDAALTCLQAMEKNNKEPIREYAQRWSEPSDEQDFFDSGKVQMQGIAVGRALDLTVLKGYRDLIYELEKMFEIEGELSTPNKWAVVFTDDEGDMMLVGDDPWPEFCKMVKKIFIYSSEEVKKTGTRCKLPASSFEGEETVVSMDSDHRSDA